MQRTIVTPPTYFAVSLDEIKDHLRVTHTDEDPYIQALLMTAQGQVESYLNRKLITQTWKAFFDDWPDGDAIVLPFGQLQSVTNVKYTDSDGDQSTFSSDDYIVDTDSEPGRVVLGYNESWPTATLYPSNPIEVQFVCGYGAHTPQDVEAASNETPIVITITGHGYTSNDIVYVYDVGGNTTADGIWAIEKVNDNTFKLLGSAGTAAHTSGGKVIKHDVPEPIVQAIKILTADLYENRETILVGTITSSLKTVKALLGNYRLFT